MSVCPNKGSVELWLMLGEASEECQEMEQQHSAGPGSALNPRRTRTVDLLRSWKRSHSD